MTFDLINDKNKKVHFIGIGGISMSGLAEILLEHKFNVSGSDMSASAATEKLIKMGATVTIGHAACNINGADLVIYTAAIANDNPELLCAHKSNIALMSRAEFLGQLMKGHKYNVAISGTHGKTTTTSMISHITLAAKLDPTILVGGNLDIIDGNVRCGKSEYFITEACEYKASFLKFFPFVGIILNIEAEHLDFYKDINEIQDAFTTFATLIPSDGFLIANNDDPRMAKVISACNCNVLTFGIKSGEITAKNIVYDSKACASFDVYRNTDKLFSLKLQVPGKHNIMNVLASTAACKCLNIDEKFIISGIESFKGTHRRFELKGEISGVKVIDDYAHHPTEIKATLSAAQKYPHKKIFCVFQPHTYSRTLKLFDDFVTAFDDCNELILADIYAAREKDTGVISSSMLGDKIRQRGLKCTNFHSFDEISKYLKQNIKSGDLLLTLGAGDIYKVGEKFLK